MEWISVKDRLPENGTEELICWEPEEEAFAYCEYFNDRFVWSETNEVINATHWMTIEKPKGE